MKCLRGNESSLKLNTNITFAIKFTNKNQKLMARKQERLNENEHFFKQPKHNSSCTFSVMDIANSTFIKQKQTPLPPLKTLEW